MLRLYTTSFLMIVYFLFFGALSQADDQMSIKALPDCPVMGKPINFGVKTSTADGDVYFCCKSCISRYLHDPTKYADKVAKQRESLASRPRVQVLCPITKKPVKEKFSARSGDKTVYACSNWCAGKMRSDMKRYESGLAKSYTYQVLCPVSGEAISPSASTVVSRGETVYFCCKGCVEKFKADPAKYAPNLAAQGYPISASSFTDAAKTKAPKPATSKPDMSALTGTQSGTFAGLSSDKTFYVTVTADPSPIPLNKLFTLKVSVFDPADKAKMLTDVSVAADAAMPSHDHGMNTKTKVEKAEEGHHGVRGMLFHMPGHWQIYIDVTRGGVTERATFDVN